METKNATKEKKPVKWDIHYSTYYWRIYLDKTHEKNNPKIDFLTGYSKQELQREASDLVYLLKSKVLNMHKNGYFERSVNIDIFVRSGEIINTKTDEKFIKLYPKHYAVNPLYTDFFNKNLLKFFTEFYKRLNENLSMENMLPEKRKMISDDDRLNIHKVRLYSLPQLYSYCSRLLLHGKSNGEVEHFMNSYKELKNW